MIIFYFLNSFSFSKMHIKLLFLKLKFDGLGKSKIVGDISLI